MKKTLYILLVVIMCIGLIGCGKKKEESIPADVDLIKEISTSNDIYSDKNHISKNGSSMTEITLYKDGTVFQRNCSVNGSCNSFMGEYKVRDELLTITLTEWMNAKGKWDELEVERVSEYEITDSNTFVSKEDSSMEFVLE